MAKLKKTTGKVQAIDVPATVSVAALAEPSMAEPNLVMHEAFASTRRNKAATIIRTDEFINIRNAPYPFGAKSRSASDGTTISASESIELSQRAYFNFPVLRNVIDVMTEFSVGKIHWKGGTAKSRQFFSAYTSKIKLWALQDQFYREYYRSGNVFIYKFMVTLEPQNVREISRTFSIEAAQGKNIVIPTRYVILNPVDIEINGTSNFSAGEYEKVLNEYEISRLQNPQNEEDKELLKALPQKARDMISSGRGKAIEIHIPLKPENLSAVFYKKQDYEPFGVPMAWPVLRDLSAKEEMKQIDMAISRVVQQAILLITMGTKPAEGGVNPVHLAAIKTLMENQSVGRVLVADYTTEAKFVIPDISNLLNPTKYEIIDNDINVGLNNIFTGGEKFANQSAKVEVFIERLKHGRESFLQSFLIPEVKKISQELGFSSWPTPIYEEYDLKNDGTNAKLYVRLAELGMLTPDETFRAMKTNQFPEPDSDLESQTEYAKQRKKGLYEPLIGAPKEPEAGRPPGSKAPKTSSKVRPMKGEEIYGAKQIMENFVKADALKAEVEKQYKKSNNLRKIGQADELILDQITKTIVANEESDKWMESVAFYLENPTDRHPEHVERVVEIAAEHSLDMFTASILLASEKK